MPNNKKIKLEEDVIKILEKGHIEGNLFFLPEGQLERTLYERVNKAIVAMGAKWDRKLKAHKFEYDISNMLKEAIKTKEVIDWKKSTDFFYTPKEVVYQMLGLVQDSKYDQIEFLEPSCRTRSYTRYCKRGIP